MHTESSAAESSAAKQAFGRIRIRNIIQDESAAAATHRQTQSVAAEAATHRQTGTPSAAPTKGRLKRGCTRSSHPQQQTKADWRIITSSSNSGQTASSYKATQGRLKQHHHNNAYCLVDGVGMVDQLSNRRRSKQVVPPTRRHQDTVCQLLLLRLLQSAFL